MGKVKASRSLKAGRHDPLEQQIKLNALQASGPLTSVAEEGVEGEAVDSSDEELVLGRASRRKKVTSKKTAAATMHGEKEFVDPKTTHKILQQAREQLQEVRKDEGLAAEDPALPCRGDEPGAPVSADDSPAFGAAAASDAADEASYEYLDESQITDEDERVLAMFRPAATDLPKRTLQDIIMEKIREKESTVDGGSVASLQAQMQQVNSLDPKVPHHHPHPPLIFMRISERREMYQKGRSGLEMGAKTCWPCR